MERGTHEEVLQLEDEVADAEAVDVSEAHEEANHMISFTDSPSTFVGNMMLYVKSQRSSCAFSMTMYTFFGATTTSKSYMYGELYVRVRDVPEELDLLRDEIKHELVLHALLQDYLDGVVALAGVRVFEGAPVGDRALLRFLGACRVRQGRGSSREGC